MKTYKWFFLILVAVVFVACGKDSTEELEGNWSIRGVFDGSPRGHAASFIIGDNGYVCCGFNGTSTRRQDCWVYSYKTDSWKEVKYFEGTARSHAVGFAIDGKGYVGTGWDGDEKIMRDFWEYDPVADSWTEVAPMPAKARERHSAVAFALKDNTTGQVYGYVGTGTTAGKDNDYLKDFWRFDPTGQTLNEATGEMMKGVWTEVQGFGGSKRYGGTVFVIDNKAYLCTGSSGSNYAVDLWMFDPNSSTLWTEKRKMYNANQDEDYDDDYADLSRLYGASFVMPGKDGLTKGYITLGKSKSSTWEYDPRTKEEGGDIWVKRTTYYNNETSGMMKEGATAFSFSGQSFVGLGVSGSQPYDDVREFFPAEEDDVYDDIR